MLAIVPLIGLIACLLIKWEPIGKDVDAEDFEGAGAAGPAFPQPAGGTPLPTGGA